MKKLLLLAVVGIALSACTSKSVTDSSDCLPSREVTFNGEQLGYVNDTKKLFSTIELPVGEYFLCLDCKQNLNYQVVDIDTPAPYTTTGLMKSVGAEKTSRLYQVKVGERYLWASYYDFSEQSREDLGIVESYKTFQCSVSK